MTLATLARKVTALNIEQVAVAAITATKEAIADLNVEQMNRGLRGDGSLMPDYSPVSVAVYGKPAGPIRLRDSGDFQGATFVNVSGVTLTIDSSDYKSPMLQKRYGKKIFGLSEKFAAEYIRELRPVFRKEVKAAINL